VIGRVQRDCSGRAGLRAQEANKRDIILPKTVISPGSLLISRDRLLNVWCASERMTQRGALRVGELAQVYRSFFSAFFYAFTRPAYA